jgi:hypothetical protein
MQVCNDEGQNDKTFLRDQVIDLMCKQQVLLEKNPTGELSIDSINMKVMKLHAIADNVFGTISSKDLESMTTQNLEKALMRLKKVGLSQNKFFKAHYLTLTVAYFVENNVSIAEYHPKAPQVYEGRPLQIPCKTFIGRLTLYLDLEKKESVEEEEDEEEGVEEQKEELRSTQQEA